MRALAPILAAAALLRAAYVSAAADPRVTFVPDCALWSVSDGGCFATSEEFINGRCFVTRDGCTRAQCCGGRCEVVIDCDGGAP